MAEKEAVPVVLVPATDDSSKSATDGETTAAVINHNWGNRTSFFRWFHPEDEVAERRVIRKLDLSILAFACAGFWILYIDRAVYANAYISGMREDLAFFGNQFVQINSIFLVGYALSIIPLTLVNTRFPPQIVIPVCMIIWGLGTVLSTRAASYGELAAYRFIVGLGEGAFFPTMNYIFGSWYRPDEISRRSGLFYVAGSIGTISNGFLAARISLDLDGTLGRASWRWMFLISGLITFPIALFGVLTFPGTPQHPNHRIFNRDELALANARLAAVGRRSTQTLSISKASLKRFFGRWHFWVIVPWSIVYQQGYLTMAQNTYALWIRSNKQYSRATTNSLTAVAPSVGIVAIVLFAWTADRFGARARVPLFAVAHTIALVGHVAFVAYDRSPFSYKWYAIAVSNVQNAMVPVMYAWVNLICAADAEERAFILSSMLAFAMAFNSWVPILSLPTVEAPRYFRGYLLCLVMQPVSLAVTFLVDFLHKREQGQIKTEDGAASEDA